MTTHYVPFFTTPAPVRLAVCGRMVSLREHTVTPTCPRCADWLAADEAEAAALAAKWDAEDAAKLKLIPKGTH